MIIQHLSIPNKQNNLNYQFLKQEKINSSFNKIFLEIYKLKKIYLEHKYKNSK